MKKSILVILCMLGILSCKKDEPIQSNISVPTLTIEEAVSWLQNSAKTSPTLSKYEQDFANAISVPMTTGNRIVIPVAGQPTFQRVKQGYREISIEKNEKSGKIEARFLEIIPEAIYFQDKGSIERKDFTGRIQEFDINYQLVKGSIYFNGKQIGESRPSTESEKAAIKEGKLDIINTSFEQNSNSGANGKIARAQVIENCYWSQTSYVDGEGVLVIYSERFCNYTIYDDGGGYNHGTDYIAPDGGGGGGGGGGPASDPTPPEPSNIPGENKTNVDPKKMTKCFEGVPSSGAAYQVKVLVSEPLPGTSFNVGPNSFGHVAIMLSKVNGSQFVTQVIGYYPSGSGFDKLKSSAVIKDNGDMEYDVSASYFTDAANFQKIIDFVNEPRPNYDFMDYNCAAFVYGAAKAGGLPVPNPTTQVGLGGPGGVTTAMTPAGMGSALRAESAADPKKNITTSSGSRAPGSKGQCN